MSSLSLGLLLTAVAAVSARLVWRRLLAYLRYFQQEGYEHVRFLKWANVRSLTDPGFWLAVGGWWLAANLFRTHFPDDDADENGQSLSATWRRRLDERSETA